MNTSQIQCCLDCFPLLRKSVLGVYAANELPTEMNIPCGFIANTDDHTKTGRHWCAFYFPNSTTIEYFDSYGMPVNYFNDYFPQYTSNFSSLITNSKQLQSLYSDVCGMYCLFFLIHRLNGVLFYDIVNMFSNDVHSNDLCVYNYVSSMFNDCVQNQCVFNQSCRALIKNV